VLPLELEYNFAQTEQHRRISNNRYDSWLALFKRLKDIQLEKHGQKTPGG
jgi:hypothetical protein